MSNLSDLLPAGAGAKSATFTASGTLATGTTVALQSDGTVTAVAETTVSENLGSDTVFESANVNYMGAAYHSVQNRVVVTYRDIGNSNYATTVAGEISGTTITFGTPTVVASENSAYQNVTYHTEQDVLVFIFRGNSNWMKAKAATLSDTTFSFGSDITLTTNASDFLSSDYDSAQNAVVTCFTDSPSGDYLKAVAVSASGTTLSAGSVVTLDSNTCANVALDYNVAKAAHTVVFRRNAGGFTMQARAFTVSGTTITNGNATQVATVDSRPGTPRGIIYHAAISKCVAIYRNNSDNYGKAVCIDVISGDTPQVFTAATFESGFGVNEVNMSIGSFAKSGSEKIVITYNSNTSNDGYVISGSISGTTITFGTALAIQANGTGYNNLTFDSTANQMAIVYRDLANSFYGTANTYNPEYTGTNVADFVGITDEAIANAATGSVVVEGGVITNSSLISKYASGGSAAVFESATVDVQVAVYDSSAQKTIIAYADAGNTNYGTVAVGTVSGTSISFGTPVVFNSANTSYIYGAYDANAGKIVLGYQDGGNSNYGTAIVGTVSGTSITFGSATVFTTGDADSGAVVYDSAAQKVAILFKDGANLNSGTGIVGTVSGTSISFGSKTAWKVGATYSIGGAYDSNAGKIVASYRDGTNANYGTAVVGTISGTSISFGSPVVYNNNGATYGSGITYDANSQKIVIAYRDGGSSNGGFGIVGTVSGTSISFGTATVFESGTTPTDISIAYDSTATSVVIVYRDVDNGSYGTAIVGSVDGTSISFGAKAAYAEVSTLYDRVVYDANANKSVVYYRDTTNSDYGTANVLTISQDLTVGSTYYVQNDGSLSTTSSSVTAGKALSSTTLLLKG
jgi:hypothetical protein